MRFHPLSDEKTRVIFQEGITSQVEPLDPGVQRQILKKLKSLCESDYPPDAIEHERIQNLQIFAAGDQIRLYTKVVTNIPSGSSEYHIIYVLYIDEGHDYNHTDLATYNLDAQRLLEEITALGTIGDVETYLEDHNAMGPENFERLLE